MGAEITDYGARPFPGLSVERHGSISAVILDRPEKRNAINGVVLDSLQRFFREPPQGIRAVVLAANGGHFCAGLDLSEHRERKAFETVLHSQRWHKAFDYIQYGRIPVVTAMKGGVIGGGLELAASTHVRVASRSCFYALPEGQRGIFVGGGATVRVGRILGAGRMIEMMLTGRTYSADEGQSLGLSHYVVPDGEEVSKAIEIAQQIAKNAEMSNYAILNAVGRIAETSATEGLFIESLMAGLVQTGPEVQERLNDFLDHKLGRVKAG